MPFGIIFAILGAFFWLQMPLLQTFSLQIFALTLIIFFAIKWISKKTQFSFLPDPTSFEIVPLSFALLILVGSTGSAQSGFFPLMYVLLLLIVLTTQYYASILIVGFLILFIYGTSELQNTQYWQAVISIPLMGVFFLYLEHQLNLSKKQAVSLEAKEESLREAQTSVIKLLDFIRDFLKPKLISLLRFGDQANTSKVMLLNQIDLLLSETEKIQKKYEAPEQDPEDNRLVAQ